MKRTKITPEVDKFATNSGKKKNQDNFQHSTTNDRTVDAVEMTDLCVEEYDAAIKDTTD
jgi:hypothetical protein